MSKNNLQKTLLNHRFAFLLTLCFSLMFSSITRAESIEHLVENKQIQVSLSVDESKNTAPKQQLVLNVDLLSVYPFAGDFKLPFLDVKNAVVIQAETQASLSTKEIDGVQWFIQRNKVILYPLNSGDYQIPQMDIKVSVISDKQGNLSGNITSQMHKFTVASVSELQGKTDVISSPKVTLKVEKQGEQADLNVGSALTYTYKIKAQKMHALMLPELKIASLNGVQIYQKPVIKKDDFDRFEKSNTAIVEQQVTFIFEKQGEFIIPEQKIIWWDTTKGQLQQAVIPAETIVVGTGASWLDKLLTNPLKQMSVDKSAVQSWGGALLFALMLLAGIWGLYRYKKQLRANFHRINKSEQRKLSKSYFDCIEKQHYAQAIACLYKVAGVKNGALLSALLDESNNAYLAQLQQRAFKPQTKSVVLSVQEAKSLFETVLKQSIASTKVTKKNPFKFSIKLNEGS